MSMDASVRRKALEAALACVGTILIVASVSVDMELARFWESFHGPALALIVAGVAGFVLISRALRVRERRTVAWAAAVAALVAIVEVVGASLWSGSSFYLMAASRGQVVKSLITASGYGILTYAAVVVAFDWLARRAISRPCEGLPWPHRSRLTMAIWGVLVAVRLPFLIAYYPGIMSADSQHQLRMAVGDWPLTNHHPLAHTLIIKACLRLGEGLGGGLTLGVGLYSALQVVAIGGVVAFVVGVMMRWGYGRTAVWLAVAVWVLYPIHSIYSVTMWKDIPFGFALLAWVVCLADVVQFRGRFFSRWTRWVPISLSGLGVILLRNNGFYVFLLSSLVFVVAWRGYRRQFAAMAVAGVAVFGLFTGPGFRALGAEPGSPREALSLPLQFFAVVSRDHPDELTAQDRATIEGVFAVEDVRDIGALYRPRVSDQVKNQFDEAWFTDHKGEFIRTWMSMVVRFPRNAVRAFLVGGFGYWYPEVVWGVVHQTNSYADLGITGTSRAGSFGAWLIDHDMYRLRAVPVVGMASSVGFTALLLMACAAFLVFRRAWRALLVLMPLFFLWLTCLASPVFGDYRYAYGLMTCLPVVLLFVYYQSRGGGLDRSRAVEGESTGAVTADAGTGGGLANRVAGEVGGQTESMAVRSALPLVGLSDGVGRRNDALTAAVAIGGGIIVTIGANLRLSPGELMHSFTDTHAVLVLVAAGIAVLIHDALSRVHDGRLPKAVGAASIVIGAVVVIGQACAIGDLGTVLVGSRTQFVKTVITFMAVASLTWAILSTLIQVVRPGVRIRTMTARRKETEPTTV